MSIFWSVSSTSFSRLSLVFSAFLQPILRTRRKNAPANNAAHCLISFSWSEMHCSAAPSISDTNESSLALPDNSKQILNEPKKKTEADTALTQLNELKHPAEHGESRKVVFGLAMPHKNRDHWPCASKHVSKPHNNDQNNRGYRARQQ
jgi:hypothetical protein